MESNGNVDQNKLNDEKKSNNNYLQEIQSILNQHELFKNLTIEEIKLINNQAKILKYEIGQTLSTKDYIASNILLILEGESRLLGNNEGDKFTILKLGPGSIIGLGSILSGNGNESVIASTKIKALSIPDELIVEFYKKNNAFKTYCEKTFLPSEIASATQLLINKSPRVDINFRKAFSTVAKFAQLKYLKKQSKLIIKEDEYVFILSKNVQDKKIGDPIVQSQIIDWLDDFTPRIITIPIQLKEEFYKVPQNNNNNKVVKTDDYSQGIIEEVAPEIPHKSSLNYGSRYQKEQTIQRAKGEPNETIACLSMLCKELEIPFRKDTVEKIIRDELKKQGSISEQVIGGITSLLGLNASAASLPSELGTRIPTPAIVKWKKSYALLQQSNANELVLISPREGLITIKSEDFKTVFPEDIKVILVEKSSITPNKKFNLEWFIPSLKKYRGSLILVLIASFIVQLFGLANPLLIQVIIDKVISQRSLDTLQILGIALVVVTILGGILGGLRTFLFAETTNRIDTRLGAEVIDHLLRLPLGYFDKRPVGELGSRIAELEKIRDFLTGQALTTILDAIFSVIYIVVMVLYSLTLTIVALGVVPIQILLTLLGSPLLRRQIREIAKQNAKTQSHLVEVLTGVQTVKAQNVEIVSRWKWQDLYSGYISRTFEKTITTTALSQVSNVLQQLSQLLVLWIGASLVLKGQMSLGQLIAFRIISGYVTQPLLRLSSIWQSIQELKVSFERLADIIDTREESSEADKANIPLPEIDGEVKFENITFRFPNTSQDVLKNINITIPKGKFVGIAGQSGSGKSTLMKLLPRLYEINNGKILIDNYNIQKIELYSLRKQIGIVPQEPLLFSGSVSENIAITNPNSSSNEIVEAAKAANAHDFIMELPEGYSTNVGERGAGLSGGQKQRIAIARTILNKPKLLIMDEATSALDYNSERKVCNNLKEACKNKTVFFITHRLSTIKNADIIIMMDQGKIHEVGSHEELIDRKGMYYALYRQQESS